MWKLVLAVLLTTACHRSSQREQCIYKDATFSVGAAQCMPSPALEGGAITVYECRSVASNENTSVMVGEWRDTKRPCKP